MVETAAESVGVADPAAPRTPEETTGAGQTSLYRVIWRWHFYAGLIVAPVLLIATATGALYVFETEVTNWLYADLYFVQPQGERLTYDEQWSIVQRAADGRDLEALMVSPDPRRSTRFITHIEKEGNAGPEHKHQIFFIDPYSGELLGTQIREEEFFFQVIDLHRTLFAGTTGRVLVELATSWGLVLLLTGAYLWLPRTKGRRRGVWWPRLRGKPYAFLRDWHAVSGIYLLAFALLILATGLFFSPVWGGGYTLLSARTGQSLAGVLLAPVESQPVPPGTAPASLETVVSRILEHSRPHDGVYIQIPQQPDHAYKAFLTQHEDVNTILTVHVDQYTGQTLSVITTEELPPLLRGLALASSLHQGKIFGLSSKILAFLSCLLLIAMIISGICMWWTRRPRGQSGFPRRPQSGSVPKWVWGLVALIGIGLPTVGASILLIAIGHWIVQRGMGIVSVART